MRSDHPVCVHTKWCNGQMVERTVWYDRGVSPILGGMLRSISQAVRLWVDDEVVVRKRSPIEAKKAAATVLRIAEECGWGNLGDMTRRSAVAWFRAFVRDGGPGAAKTAHNHRSRLRAFVAFLAETDDAPADLFDGIRLPAARTARGASAFTWDEMVRLIARARQMERNDQRAGKYGPMRSTFYAVLALTGLRHLEAKSQRWDDINLERRTLTVTADKSRRRDPLRYNAECAGVLRAWRRYSRGEILFPHTPSHHSLVADMEACGIASVADGRRGQWHRFRKGLCTQLAIQGVSPEERRKAMRHTDTRITMDLYTDAEVVENSVSACETTGLLPPVKKSARKDPPAVAKSARIGDYSVAERMDNAPNNIVNQKSAACPSLSGLSNRPSSEPRSSDSRTRTSSNGAGGNRPYGSILVTLASVIDSQIRTLMELRAALN